jgi:hypothetical protein
MPQSDAEIEALWVATFGEPPAIKAGASLLADILFRYSPAPLTHDAPPADDGAADG